MHLTILLGADQDTEPGKMPNLQLLRDMGDYNQQQIDAGFMQSCEGLQPTPKGAGVHIAHGRSRSATVPFP